MGNIHTPPLIKTPSLFLNWLLLVQASPIKYSCFLEIIMESDTSRKLTIRPIKWSFSQTSVLITIMTDRVMKKAIPKYMLEMTFNMIKRRILSTR